MRCRHNSCGGDCCQSVLIRTPDSRPSRRGPRKPGQSPGCSPASRQRPCAVAAWFATSGLLRPAWHFNSARSFCSGVGVHRQLNLATKLAVHAVDAQQRAAHSHRDENQQHARPADGPRERKGKHQPSQPRADHDGQGVNHQRHAAKTRVGRDHRDRGHRHEGPDDEQAVRPAQTAGEQPPEQESQQHDQRRDQHADEELVHRKFADRRPGPHQPKDGHQDDARPQSQTSVPAGIWLALA